MKFLTMLNIWEKIKDYCRNFSSNYQAITTNIQQNQELPSRILGKMAKTKSCPVKRYCFKQFEFSLESQEQNDKLIPLKTKKIRKQKKVVPVKALNLNECNGIQDSPHFFDEYGQQVSSIGKRSNKDDSFDIKEFEQIFKDELDTLPMISKQKQKRKKGFNSSIKMNRFQRKYPKFDDNRFRKKDQFQGIKLQMIYH